MPELRLDLVARRWVVTGKRRVMPDVKDTGASCAFCPGFEHLTPTPIREIRDAAGNWLVRAFHDRAPLFRIEGGADRRPEGMFDRMNTVGAHEIVVETPHHGVTLAQLPVEQITRVAQLCRDRILDLKQDHRFRYVSLFKDQRPMSESLPGHAFAQIIATPVLPQQLEIEFRWSRAHYLRKERCLFCDILQQEIRQEKRVVDQNADFIALCPFASRSPYELWVLPVTHASSFERDLQDSARATAFAPFLKACLQRVEKLSDALHVVVHTEPNLVASKPAPDWWSTIAEDFHWHLEIHPDIEGQRRYLGSDGFYFNPIPAEEAAIVLRAFEPGAEPPPAPEGP